MQKEIILPKLGLTMTRGTITQWHKNVGDDVAVGDALFTFETDKVTQTVECEWNGKLSTILTTEGETADVFAVVGIIEQTDLISDHVDRMVISPVAKRLAAEHKIRLMDLPVPVGKRIEIKDVEAYLAAQKNLLHETTSNNDENMPIMDFSKNNKEYITFAIPQTPVVHIEEKKGEKSYTKSMSERNPSILIAEVDLGAFEDLCTRLSQSGDDTARERLLNRASRTVTVKGVSPRVAYLKSRRPILYIPGEDMLPVLSVGRNQVVLTFRETDISLNLANEWLGQYVDLLEIPELFLAQ